MAAGSLLLAGAVPIPPRADTERRSRAEEGGAALTAHVRRIVQHHIAQLTTNQGKVQCVFVFV